MSNTSYLAYDVCLYVGAISCAYLALILEDYRDLIFQHNVITLIAKLLGQGRDGDGNVLTRKLVSALRHQQ